MRNRATDSRDAILEGEQGGGRRANRELTTEEVSELARGEQEAWQNMLGAHVEIKPLPDSVTFEVKSNLKRMGFALRYVPSIDLGSIATLQKKGVNKYLTELGRKYPNWKPFESLPDREKEDHSVPRNLERWFWERVVDEDIAFPELPGQWLAIETLEKPTLGTKYQRTLFAEHLGFRENRFNLSWDDIKHVMDFQKHHGILSGIGLTNKSDIRFLNILEWNLLGNREGWGKTNTFEWTETEFHGFNGAVRLVVGDSDRGGAAAVGWGHPDGWGSRIGFRAAVVLDS